MSMNTDTDPRQHGLAEFLRGYLNDFSMLPPSTSIAAVVLARLSPVVETEAGLEALPDGTFFESDGRLGRIWNGHASSLDGGPVWKDKKDALPVRVVWIPQTYTKEN